MTVRRKVGSVQSNPIGLDQTVAHQAIGMLQGDLARMFMLFNQYQKHHWGVSGPEHRELHRWMGELAEHTLEDADHIAERIISLGGVPLDTPAGLEEAATIRLEQAGIVPVREMLANDLQAEQEILLRLREHIRSLAEFGDFGSEDLLRQLLIRHEDYAKNLALYLEADGLTLGLLAGRQDQKGAAG